MVGAGQLARMTQQAAIGLGIELRVLAAGPDDPAAAAGARAHAAPDDDLDALRAFAAGCDVLTFDHEGVPPEHLRALEAEGHRLRPDAAAKLAAQDKLHARERLAAAGLPVPDFAPVAGPADIERFAARHSWPVVLKARRGGYDGRGVAFAGDPDEAAAVLARGGEWLAERHVAIELELAALLARRPSGETVAWPVIHTIQVDGMCRELHAPAPVEPALAGSALELARAVADAVGASGVLAVELFATAGGGLLVNELALRPHNSGHFTIEGSATSQFENHLRAVLDWPLGITTPRAPHVATVNVVGGEAGDPLERLPEALAVPGAHVHLYGKAPRPERKLGHVTALADTAAAARATARRAAALLSGEPGA